MVDEIIKKKFYKSKTFWVNVIALGALILQSHYGFALAIDEQAAIIVVINLILRAVTKEGLSL